MELWTRGGENMSDYKLTLAEKETIILWSEADDTVQIDTFSQKLINRLRKAKERCPELYRVDEPDCYGGVYAEVPKNSCRYPSVSRSARNAASSTQGSQKNASTQKIKQGC